MIQTVLLFRVETWVLNSRMERALSSFQHRVARRLTGRQPRRQGNGSQEYPSLADALVESGFKGIGKYITRRQNMIAQYIATRPFLDLCDNYSRKTGERVSQRWWEKAGLYLVGAKKRAAAAAAELDREESIGRRREYP